MTVFTSGLRRRSVLCFKSALCMLVLAGLCVVSSCSKDEEAPAHEADVLCSTLPLYSLAAAIAGSNVDVELLPKPNVGPHSYHLTLQDRARLNAAKLVVLNGLELEAELPDAFIEELGEGGTTIVEAASKLGPAFLLEIAETESHEGHDHSAHDHGHHDHHHHHHHGVYDPHVWLCRDGLLAMSDEIEQALAKTFPEHKEAFANNRVKLDARINESFDQARAELSGIKGQRLMTFHDAWGYFAREFDMEIAATVTLSGRSISLQKREEIEGMLRSGEIGTVFVEPQFDAKAIRGLAKDTGANIAVLDPAVTTNKKLTPDVFFEILGKNVAELKRVFAPQQ